MFEIFIVIAVFAVLWWLVFVRPGAAGNNKQTSEGGKYVSSISWHDSVKILRVASLLNDNDACYAQSIAKAMWKIREELTNAYFPGKGSATLSGNQRTYAFLFLTACRLTPTTVATLFFPPRNIAITNQWLKSRGLISTDGKSAYVSGCRHLIAYMCRQARTNCGTDLNQR